jgi:hypothetical protein
LKIVSCFVLPGYVIEGAVERDGVEPIVPGECGGLDIIDGFHNPSRRVSSVL